MIKGLYCSNNIAFLVKVGLGELLSILKTFFGDDICNTFPVYITSFNKIIQSAAQCVPDGRLGSKMGVLSQKVTPLGQNITSFGNSFTGKNS